MANKICRINGTYEFPFDFFGERASFNEITKTYEPILRFQVNLEAVGTFVTDLIPYMGKTVTLIEVCDANTKEVLMTMSTDYDTIVDVSTNFPQSADAPSGHIVFSNSAYAIASNTNTTVE